jgi:regulator of replication initiation timing
MLMAGLLRFFGSVFGKATIVLMLVSAVGYIGHQIKEAIEAHAALVSERDQLKSDLATTKREAEIAKENHASELASARINTEIAASVSQLRADSGNSLTLTIGRINDAARNVETAPPSSCGYPLHPSLSVVLERLLDPSETTSSGGYRQGEAGPP